MKDAIRQTSVGVILDLEISPGANETSVHGYNPWRKRIEVRLSERAQMPDILKLLKENEHKDS